MAELEDITDYSSLTQMNKDFTFYYNLWTVVETWYNSHNSWLNDPFDELNAEEVEEVVDHSNKTMA